jgi:hypothetical protein
MALLGLLEPVGLLMATDQQLDHVYLRAPGPDEGCRIGQQLHVRTL